MDDRERFVRELYLGVLKRGGEESGIKDHLDWLGDAPSFKEASDLLHTFVNSPEAKACRVWRNPPMGQTNSVKDIVSIGSHCAASQMLKNFDLKKYSGPFDWLFSSIPMVTHCIEDNFATFLNRKYHQPVPIEKRYFEDANFCHHKFYKEKFGILHVFNHYDISIEEHYNYYVRCVKRFTETLNSEDRNLLVALCREPVTEDEFNRLCDAVDKYPASEVLVVRAIQSDWTRFGAQLAAERGRHKLVDLYMTGSLGALDFDHPADEMTFRRLIDNCQ